MNLNRFIVCNDWSDRLEVFVEPEGAVVELGRGESICVRELFWSAPVTVKLGVNSDGSPMLSLWPGDGDMVVEKDGVNVLGAGNDSFDEVAPNPVRYFEYFQSLVPLQLNKMAAPPV